MQWVCRDKLHANMLVINFFLYISAAFKHICQMETLVCSGKQ